MNLLQIGYGNFGKQHYEKWKELGITPIVAEVDEIKNNIEHHVKDYKQIINDVDAVDIVTPATTHYQILQDCLKADKYILVEKPMTMSSQEAKHICSLPNSNKIQVGFHYRNNKLTNELKNRIDSLGKIRYINGRFLGLKRPRTDVGVAHTDAIHFIDLFNYIKNSLPNKTNAEMRTYFPRGKDFFGGEFDDLSLIKLYYNADFNPNESILEFKGGRDTLAFIEAGYIQPGDYEDPFVKGALTTKEIFVCGEKGFIKIDYEGWKFIHRKANHIKDNDIWKLVVEEKEDVNVAKEHPLISEFKEFIDTVKNGCKPKADAWTSGYWNSIIIEKIYESARNNVTKRIIF